MRSSKSDGRPAPLWLALAGVLASAAMFVAAFPPARLRPLAWVALAPLLVALRRSPLGRAVALAGIWGMTAAYGVTDWLPPAIANYYHQPLWMGYGLFLTAALAMGAADYMAFGACYWLLARRGRRPLAPLAAAAWVAAELGRSRILGGNPWGLLGYTQAGAGSWGDPTSFLHRGSLAVAQVADLAGVYGVSFVLVAANAALAELWLVAVRASRSWSVARAELAAAAALTLAAFGYGSVRLATVTGLEQGRGATRAVPIAIIQGNLDLGSRWSPDFYGRNLDIYLRLTRESARQGAPQLVFWPESAMTFFVDREPVYRRAIARVLKPLGAQLVAGAPRYEAGSPPVYFNSAFLLSPAGSVLAHYDKQHLLPFAEYFPLAGASLLKRSFGRVRQFTPGRPSGPLPTRAGAAGVVICNEAMFPRIVRRRVLEGAGFLVNLANDSWIPSREFAEHQFDTISMRAIEFRRYLVRASTSGPSAVVTPSGRVQARTEPLTRTYLRGRIRTLAGWTVYARFGDAFAWLCLVAAAAGALLPPGSSRPLRAVAGWLLEQARRA